MNPFYSNLKKFTTLGLALAALPSVSWAHCDSMEGPVIAQAREALLEGDVTPTLKWVEAEHEAEIRRTFAHVMEVRTMGGEAAELADRYFFETLVRIHREGEGAPYTGLRPVGDLEPIYAAADHALIEGSADHLAAHLAENVEKAIKERFAAAFAKSPSAEANVEAGRDYVMAYVEYMHLVEAIHETLTHGGGHGSPHGH